MLLKLVQGAIPVQRIATQAELLADAGKLKAFKHAVESRGLTISALSAHGNPLHPQKHIAKEFHDAIIQTIDLAERLEVPVVNTFSGCPGDHEDAKYPNWPVAPWPNDFQEILGLAVGEIKSFLTGQKQANTLPIAISKLVWSCTVDSPYIRQQPFFVCAKQQVKQSARILIQVTCGGKVLILFKLFKFLDVPERFTISTPKIRPLMSTM